MRILYLRITIDMLLLRDGWCPPNVRGYYLDSAFQRKLQHKSVLITNSKQLETTRKRC